MQKYRALIRAMQHKLHSSDQSTEMYENLLRTHRANRREREEIMTFLGIPLPA